MHSEKKNEIVTLQVTDLGRHGEGIGRTADGYTLFVPGTIWVRKAEKNSEVFTRSCGSDMSLRRQLRGMSAAVHELRGTAGMEAEKGRR